MPPVAHAAIPPATILNPNRQVMAQGFDSAFVRCFNYYFAYCEAGFASRTEGLLMLTFARPGTASLNPNALTSVLMR